MKLWCKNQLQQIIGGEMCTICMAHLAEGRVLDCPYDDNSKRMKSKYPCVDYKELENE